MADPSSDEPTLETDAPTATIEKAEDAAVHSQAAEILRQVEVYFSDGNLPTDGHLLALCGGAENLPVSINEIFGWRNMRKLIGKKSQAARKAAIDVLKQSEFLEILNDDKQVRRRVPLDASLISEERKMIVESKPEEPIPAHLTKGMLKPTGFEPNWCDAPVTPTEYEEDVAMYDPDLPFSDRIQCAIQRYKARRKFHQNIAYVFNSFMSYGGVDCGPRQFGGVSDKDLEEYDATQIAIFKATHFVDQDKDDENKWAVDFEGVAKAYLSSYYPVNVRKKQTEEDFELATRIVMNFYNYLLHHNVCPEYMGELLAARAVCTQAMREMPAVDRMVAALPGDFNKACSAIFGGYHSDMTSFPGQEQSAWGKEEHLVDMSEARALVAFALRTHSKPKVGEEPVDGETDSGSLFHCIQTITAKETGFEIVHIELPTKASKKAYARSAPDTKTVKPQALGKLVLKRWALPDYADYDLPPPEVSGILDITATINSKTKPKNERIEVWFEADVLEHAFIGMRLAGEFRRMAPVATTGAQSGSMSEEFWYLDVVSRVYSSFHTELLNELDFKVARIKWYEGPNAENVEDKKDKTIAEAGNDDDGSLSDAT